MEDYIILETIDLTNDGAIKRLCLVEYPDKHLGLLWIEGIEYYEAC